MVGRGTARRAGGHMGSARQVSALTRRAPSWCRAGRTGWLHEAAGLRADPPKEQADLEASALSEQARSTFLAL